jgi:hypothetical protein
MLNPSKPTSYDVKLAKMFMSVAGAMAEELEIRGQTPETASDLITRYAPLKNLLDDSLIPEHTRLDKESLYIARKRRRSQYEILLSDFMSTTSAARAQVLANRDARKDWAATARIQGNAWVIQTVILELRLALLLHLMHVPLCSILASHAYEYLRRCFPPAPIIPMRAQ